ncbi:MAG: response regulator [Chloroflexaceae bacterium]|nr:response regulator [Chloroflexaceae bacterium]
MAFFWKSLLARLMSYFVLLSLVITGVAGIVAFVQATDTLERSLIERLRVAALARQDELAVWISTQANDLSFVSRWNDIVEPTTTIIESDNRASLDYQVAYTQLAETLRDIVVRRPDFEELFMLNNDGVVIVSSQGSNEDLNLSDTRYAMLGRNQTFIQNVYPDPATGQPRMTIATPLLDSLGRRLGVLAVHLNLDRMDRIILDRAGLGDTGEMYLIDETGVFVSAQRFGRQEFSRQVHSEGIDRALAGESGTGRYLNYQGIPVIGAYQWLDHMDLALLVEMHRDEAFAPINQLALNITFAGLIAAGILIIGVYLVARQIVRPIRQLTQTAHAVAAGNLNAQAEVTTRDEIGELTQVFNQMTNQLRELYEDMEQQVRTRTVELTRTNEQLTSEISERRRIETQLVQAKEQAEAANRAKSTFLANMSHELRTPLSAIIGFAQLLQRDPMVGAEQQEYLTIITRSGQHLSSLINEVLEMSKIEAGRTRLDKSRFHLHHVLNDVISLLSLRAREKSLDLSLEYAPTMPTVIFTDEGKLRQILINLLGNAIKFTHQGYVELRVSVSQHALSADQVTGAADGARNETATGQQRQWLHFDVADSGPGIAPEDQEQVFDPFFQTEAVRNLSQGTGLGLAISQQYARLMGGDITLKSEIGVGSTFRLTLPVVVLDANEQPAAENPDRRVAQVAPDQPGYRVLVTDDSPDTRRLLVNLLESAGFVVQSAADGQDCVMIWEDWQPHLIWMDMRMPRMDGFQATHAIRTAEQNHHTDNHHTVIIALTASAFEDERSRILAAGCDDFVGKPFREADIFEQMAQHLGVRYVYHEDANVS